MRYLVIDEEYSVTETDNLESIMEALGSAVTGIIDRETNKTCHNYITKEWKPIEEYIDFE